MSWTEYLSIKAGWHCDFCEESAFWLRQHDSARLCSNHRLSYARGGEMIKCDDTQCQRYGSFPLDGKLYCSEHFEANKRFGNKNSAESKKMNLNCAVCGGLANVMTDGVWYCAIHVKSSSGKAFAGISRALTQQFDASLAGFVNKERGDVYGHPVDQFERAANLKLITSDCSDPVLREALDAIAVKISRLIQSPEHFDSWLDIAGYARCAVMILDKRKEE